MPVLFIILPLLGVIVLNLLNKGFGKKIVLGSGIAITVIQMILSATAGMAVWQQMGKSINIQLVSDLSIDFLSAVVLFTIGLIAFVSFIVGKYSGDKDVFNFSNLILIIMMGMNGAVMVKDLFSLYVFLEITAVTSFILIALRKDRDALEGSFKYFIMSAVATIFMLLSIAIIFMLVGDVGFEKIYAHLALGSKYPAELVLAFVLFMTGLLIKAGVVPFHGWVPGAYSSAPPAVSVLLAGIVTKVAGVYALMRLYADVFKGIQTIGSILVIFGLISIVIGAVAAMGQTDFKKMLAFSSISQVGYIVLGVGFGTPLGFAGAILHFFNHATFKSLLFVNSASVEAQTGTRDINKLGGLASRMPVTGGSSVIGFLSTAGIPPLSGFWSKLLIIIAAWQAAFYAPAAIALLASLITLAYFLILQRKVFFGKIAEGLETVTEGNIGFKGAAILLSAITLAMGLLFPVVLIYMQSIGLI